MEETLYAWLPHKHFVEHVAGNKVAMVGRWFGRLLGRFGSWAKNEVCFARAALQLSLMKLGH
jgi:hypothetical protein